MTQQQTTALIIFVIILIFLPYISRRTGIDFSKLFFGVRTRKMEEKSPEKKAVSKQRNHTQNDLLNYISFLMRFCRKNGMQLVCPARFHADGEDVGLTAVVVGKFGAIGIYCLGFGGKIYTDQRADYWRQELSGNTNRIVNPDRMTAKWDRICKEYLKPEDMQDLPIEVVTVFTNQKLNISGRTSRCYLRDDFKEYLLSRQAEGTVECDRRELALKLKTYIDSHPVKIEKE